MVELANVLEFKAKVLKSRDYFEKGNLAVKILNLEIPKNFSYKSGQFVMISVDEVKNPEKPEQLRWSAFSIASSPLEKNLELIVGIKTHFGVTKYIGEKVKEGSFINIRGPYGFFNLEKAEEYIFVAIGTGIAPIISLIRNLLESKSNAPITLFYGVRCDETFYYGKELEKLSKENSNFKLIATASREESPAWKCSRGYVQELLEKYVPPKKKSGIKVYLCGNPQMVSDATEIFYKKGFVECQLHSEKW